MTAAVLSIGTELTRGELVNTNASWLGEELTKLGFDVTEHATVDDDLERIVTIIRRFSERHRVVDRDWRSRTNVGRSHNRGGRPRGGRGARARRERRRGHSPEVSAFGRVMPESNAKQGDFPEGADRAAEHDGDRARFCDDPRPLRGSSSFLAFPREMKHIFKRVDPRRDRAARRAAHAPGAHPHLWDDRIRASPRRCVTSNTNTTA